MDSSGEDRPMPSLGAYLWKAFREAHARRPASFYLLLCIPLVMLLGLKMLLVTESPKQFAFILSLMFVFFGVVALRALVDAFEIIRKRIRDERRTFQETLGAEDFTRKLGDRIGRGRKEW